jgi:uncharacterized protein
MIRAPMARPLEDPLDVGALAAQQAELDRTYEVAGFERLRGSLARPEGRATADFRFHDAGTYPVLEGEVRATVWLVCQRCLNEFETVVESSVRVAFVATDAEAARVPDEYDAVTAPFGRVQLEDLVEDELLLALPLVPMHATLADCTLQTAAQVECEAKTEAVEAAAATEAKGPVQRPFGDLRNLLKR